MPFGGTSAETQVSRLRQVRPYLPPSERVRITFYGDAEFRAVPVQAYCRQQTWHWHVGLKSDLRFQTTEGVSYALRDLPVERRHHFRHVAHLFLQQTEFVADALSEMGNLAELGVHPSGEDDGGSRSGGHARPGEDRIGQFGARPTRPDHRIARLAHGMRFARQCGLIYCQKLNAPLITLTSQIATPSCGICAMKPITPPTHSSSAIRCVKLARNLRMSGCLLLSRRVLGPRRRRRASASA